LDLNLRYGQFPGRVFPGVTDLLGKLAADSSVGVGLLTGNTAGGAAAKMRHYGLAGYFPFGAYGSDHADRNLLGPIALQRAAAHASRNFTAKETWVIGDTPKDIACAHALGARCLAVATGQFTAKQLEAYGADQVVESLEQEICWD
jgi:phosphoglycolate phosphatase